MRCIRKEGRREGGKEGRREGGKGEGEGEACSDVGNRVSEYLKNDRHCMREVKHKVPSYISCLLVVGWAMSCCPTQLEHSETAADGSRLLRP